MINLLSLLEHQGLYESAYSIRAPKKKFYSKIKVSICNVIKKKF